jgi:hypothetical protein
LNPGRPRHNSSRLHCVFGRQRSVCQNNFTMPTFLKDQAGESVRFLALFAARVRDARMIDA